MRDNAGDLAARLAQNAESVCRHYLSNGRREGNYWMVGDALNAPGRSLYVRLRGPTSGKGAAGRWTDAATLEHGDLLDIIRSSCNFPTVVKAMDEARRFLVVPRPEAPKPAPVPHSSPETARRLFAMGLPIRGTLAETYLRKRAITADLTSLPLRFHPSCYYSPGENLPRETRPALLAAVTDVNGGITGVHRTWLDPLLATKARVSTPRKSMGQLLGNGVKFEAANAQVLAAGEGLETMLSLRSVLPTMPMVAALSASHLAALLLPAGLKRLYVAQDNDRAGLMAVSALRDRDDLFGIDVRELVPIEGDFNDDLRRWGATALFDALTSQLAQEDRTRFVTGPRRDVGQGFVAPTS